MVFLREILYTQSKYTYMQIEYMYIQIGYIYIQIKNIVYLPRKSTFPHILTFL